MNRLRAPRLRGRLTRNLVGVALVSVLLLSGVNYVFARVLINESVESQLIGLRDSRIEAIERGVARAKSAVSTMATSPTVVAALIGLTAEYARLDQDIASEQIGELETLYEAEVLPPFIEAGVDLPPVREFVPGSPAGRYLQLKYIAENPAGFDERDDLDDAGDGSGYSRVHADFHPVLRDLMRNAGMSDLLLVDLENGDVVYSTKKHIDFGTDAIEGPYGDTGLGEALDGLTGVAVGDTVVSDSWFYIPTRGEPVFFLAAAVRSGSEVIGAVVTEIPVGVLTDIISAGQDWRQLGLGDTGEIYIVGSDQTLRSNSRLWLEDPDAYLQRYVARYDDQRTADLMQMVGSPVLLQRVDDEAVVAGLDGDEFIGTVTSYLGTKTLTAAGPAAAGDLDWVVIAEQAKSESSSALDSYVRRILLVLGLLVPTVAALGAFLARTISRPVDSLVQAADGLARGDLATDIPELGRNELGDLARQLDGVARRLEEREQGIVDEERKISDMLAAVLPDRLVDRVRMGEVAIDDMLDNATVISVTLDAMPEATGPDQDVVLELTERINEEVDELAARHNVERLRRSPGSELFVAGLDQDDANAAGAVRFALAVVGGVAQIGREFGQALTARAGLAAGEVATGVLGSNQVAFGVWGDAPGIASTLDSLAQPGQVLVDDNVVDELGPDWDIGPNVELPGLADDVAAYAVRRDGHDLL